MRLLFLLCGLLAGALNFEPAQAREEILSFDARIEIRKDGAFEVVETITVRAEGREIRRGIFRDIPLRAVDEWGFWTRDKFTITDIRHNGADSPYRTEWMGRFLRIYIGDADVLIAHGQHVYTIAYTTSGQLRSFSDYDEIYWNVTGNFWAFPILQSSATIVLPQGASATQVQAYTGAFGQDGSDFIASGPGGRTVEFAATRTFAPGEGMTVAVGFPKGFAALPTRGVFSSLWANKGAVIFGLGWLFVIPYFLVTWWRLGRDPPGEIIIPLFHPPEDLSPAAMSFVHFKSFRSIGRGTDMAFVAALLSLGVKKYLRIDEDDDGKVVFNRGEGADASLSSGERAIHRTLFNTRQAVPLDKRYGKLLLSARSKLHAAISREYGGKFFKHNIGWFIPGALVAIVATILGLILQAPPDDGLAAILPTLFTSIAGWVLLIVGWKRFSDPMPSWVSRILGSLLIGIGLLLLLLALSVAAFATELPAYRFAALLLVAGVALVIGMVFLLAAPTLKGAKVLSRIEGFKLYLQTAEANRLNMRDAPQMSEELYERFLPYAAGLGVEEPWSNAYSAHLARVAPDQQRSYQPQWYHGRSFSGGTLGEATSASMAAVSAAMAASMPQPKSSSGSSGGGFSGGGGGGGGGGGW